MTAYYVKNGGSDAAAGTSDGAALATLNAALTSGTIAASGNTIYLRCGDVFDERVDLSSITVAGSGWTLDCYGDGALPIITRAKRDPAWTQELYGTWSHTLSGNGGGLVSEDEYPLRWVEWDTNLATTAAVMAAGDFTFDPVGFKYYIIPRSGTPSDHSYIASAGAYGFNASTRTDWTVQNVRFEYCSGFGIYVPNGQRYTIQDSEFAYIGGWYGAGANAPQGDAIAPFDTAIDVIVRRNLFEEIFDAACYVQAFNNSKTISNVLMADNTVRKCGLLGLGGALLGSGITGCTLSDVRAVNNDISGMGEGWSEDRGAQGVNFSNTSTQSTSNAAGCLAQGNKIRGGNICMNIGGVSGAFVSNDCRDAAQASMRVVGSASKAGVLFASGNLHVGDALRAIWVDATNATAVVSNDTVIGAWAQGARNAATTGGGLSIYNTIIQGATVGIEQTGSVATTADHNCIHDCATQESGLASTNTLSTDPLLDASYRLYTLKAGSPCIDAGTLVSGVVLKDYEGKDIIKATPDIGAQQVYTARTRPATARTPR